MSIFHHRPAADHIVLQADPKNLKAVATCVNFIFKTIYLHTGLNDGHMSDTLKNILRLIRDGDIVVSNHGYDELAEDALTVREILDGVSAAVVIEDYPVYPKGPCALVLQQDADGKPIHVVWGIPKGRPSPAVLVTAYRPEPSLWSADFLRRLS